MKTVYLNCTSADANLKHINIADPETGKVEVIVYFTNIRDSFKYTREHPEYNGKEIII